MTDSILFVDDATDLLLGLQVMFRARYAVEVAAGAEEGLAALHRHGPYSVVMADMRMPGMNGAEFLAQVREIAPDSTRMLLTGNADISTAVEAVNQGNIYRFLTKPCDRQALTEAIEAGIGQHRLLIRQRERRDGTQLGNIGLLTDLLRAANPAISAKSMRIGRNVRHIGRRLQLATAAQVEAAASLSQLGCVTLPPHLVEQAYVGARLSAEEQALYHAHPEVGRTLLANIPTMEPIAWILGQQFVRDIPKQLEGVSGAGSAALVLGARILKLTAAFDAYRMKMLTDKEALSRLRSREDEFEKPLVDVLAEVETVQRGMELRRVPAAQLEIGMVLEQDLCSRQGMLKMAKGQEVTPALRIKLYSLVHAGIVEGHVLVQAPV